MKTDIDKKIEEFFFDPAKTINKYNATYRTNNPKEGVVRFSPLYLACRDIYYCFGKNPEKGTLIETGSNFGPAIFIGFALTYQTINMVAETIGLRPEEYIQKFFNLSQTEAESLRELRHAITHNKYSLIRKDHGEKIGFDISNFSDKIITIKNVPAPYWKAYYTVNATLFRKYFFKSLEILREKLTDKNDETLRKIFNDQIRHKHWVVIKGK